MNAISKAEIACMTESSKHAAKPTAAAKPKKPAAPKRQGLTAMELIALNQKIGQADANTIALPILIYMDAAHRGIGNAATENALVRVVVTAQVLGSKSGNRAFYDASKRAGAALCKAAARDRENLSLTTGEYAAIRHMVAGYVRMLPALQVKMFVFACARAEALITEMEAG